MEEIAVKALEIEGKKFLLIESIEQYNFFVEEDNFENICILKEIIKNGESFLTDIEDNELDKAFSLYYEKLKK